MKTILIYAFISYTFAVIALFFGLHNFDTGHNVHWLNEHFKADIRDDGMTWNRQISLGFVEIMSSMSMFMISFILLGIYIKEQDEIIAYHER